LLTWGGKKKTHETALDVVAKRKGRKKNNGVGEGEKHQKKEVGGELPPR